MSTTTSSTNPIKPHNAIDEALAETEIGSFIAKNKVAVIGLVIFSIVGVFAYGIFSHFQTAKYDKYSDTLFAFANTDLKNFSDKKMAPMEIFSKYKEISSSMSGFPGLAQYHIRLSDSLMEQGAMKEARELLEDGYNAFSKPAVRYFFATRLAVIHEDAGENAESIKYLQGILGGPARYLEDKVYLDLGRLYLAVGDKEKARASFNWVVEKASEEEFKKLAKLHLGEI